MNKKKLSIIVPVYNVEKYLEKCLNSLVNQSLTNIEIILVEDCSTDNSKSICELYERKYDNVKLITHEFNQGLSAARNTGLDIAKGHFITFVDSDDWVDIDTYEIMIKSLEGTNADMCIYGFRELLRNNEKDYLVTKDTDIINSRLALEYFFKGKITANSWNKVYKKSLFDKNKIRFQIGKFAEDQYPTFLSLFYSKNILLIPEVKYFYNRRNESLTTSRFSKKNYDVIEHLILMKDFMKENNILHIHEKNYQVRFYKVIFSNIVKKIALSNPTKDELDYYILQTKLIYKKHLNNTLYNKSLSLIDKLKIGLMKRHPIYILKIIKAINIKNN